MNNSQIKKALNLFIAGHTIKDIAQFTNIDAKQLGLMFTDNKIENASDAIKFLKNLESELEDRNKDGGKWDKGGEKVAKFVPAKPTYAGKYDRNKLVKFEKKEILPLSLERKFRNDLKYFGWKELKSKWTEALDITESELKEELKRLSPRKYDEYFGD